MKIVTVDDGQDFEAKVAEVRGMGITVSCTIPSFRAMLVEESGGLESISGVAVRDEGWFRILERGEESC